MVENLPCNSGDASSIPGWGTTIPHATGQLSLHTTTKEPACCNYRAHALWSLRTQLESPCTATTEPMRSETCAPQLETNLHAETKSTRATMKDPVCHNEDLMQPKLNK